MADMGRHADSVKNTPTDSSAEDYAESTSGNLDFEMSGTMESGSVSSGETKPSMSTFSTQSSQTSSASTTSQELASATTDPSLYSVMGSTIESELTPLPSWRRPSEGRRIYLLRNSERVDRLFPGWLKLSINNQGEYMPYDANLPVRLPKRIGGRMAYRCDCPITILGRLEAKMIGRALHSKNLLPQRIFVSPAMRCIATARGLLKGLQMSGLRMCIEPGLFDYLGWYKDHVPAWITVDELLADRCKVDKKYTPVMTREQVEVCQSERVQQFYERCGKVVRKLLENNADVKSMLLIVHSSTMDAISRELLGHRPEALSRSQMEQMGFYYPYSAFVAFEEQKEDNTWHVIDDALPPLTCRKFSNCVDRAFLDRP